MHRDRARLTGSLGNAHGGRRRQRETGGGAGELSHQRIGGTGVYIDRTKNGSTDGWSELNFDNAVAARRQRAAGKRTSGASGLDLEVRCDDDIQWRRAAAGIGDRNRLRGTGRTYALRREG